MPPFRDYSRHRKTPRALILEALTRLEFQLFLDASQKEMFTITPLFLKVFITKHFFKTNRYLNPRTPIFKSSTYRDKVLTTDNGTLFQDALRLSPEQFEYVLEIIRDHSVFQRQGKKPQMDVAIQLKVGLHRLAHDGSLVSYKAIGRVLGVTEGTAIKYSQRVIEALCAHISRFVSWPDVEAKAIIKAVFAKKGFKDLLGAIDGTLFPLYRVPSMDKNSWATRKGNFAMGATGVCDHRGVFIFFSTGYPGSRHDSAAYKDTELYRFQNRYFEGDEYMVGDAAYGLSPTLMTAFKGALTPCGVPTWCGAWALCA